MTEAKTRAKRREQQAAEIEANQAALRTSIAESERLVGEADNISAVTAKSAKMMMPRLIKRLRRSG